MTLTEQKQGEIISARKSGKSYRQIAKLVGCDAKTVGNVLKRHNNPSQISPDRRGRPPLLDETARDRLTQLVLGDRRMTKRKIQAVLEQQEGKVIIFFFIYFIFYLFYLFYFTLLYFYFIYLFYFTFFYLFCYLLYFIIYFILFITFILFFKKFYILKVISQRTISRTLKKANLFARVARAKPFINAKTKKERQEWAEMHLTWTTKDWKNVLWSDEKFFCLIPSNPHQYVWRRPEEEFDDDCLVPAIRSKGIMVWGCFSWWGLGPLVRLHGSITSVSYRRTLSRYAVPVLQDQYPNGNGVFQHDGASVHRGTIVKKYLANKQIKTLNWPPYSPDLNPIENLWSEIEEKLRKRRPKPGNLTELERMVKEEWKALSPSYFRHLVESEVDRVKEIYEKKGGHSHY
jgi:transposase